MRLNSMRRAAPSSAVSGLLIACMVALAPAGARGDYKLGTGDVIELRLFGVPDFTRRATINADGEVSVPLVGQFTAAGLSLAAMREALAERLAKTGVFTNPDITIELIDHSPFYVNGFVTRPGVHAYRPGMTVRQALAVAGGVDASRQLSGNPLLVVPSLESEAVAGWTELVRNQARAISLQAELNGERTPRLEALYAAPVSRSFVAEVAQLEVRSLQVRLDSATAQKDSLTNSIAETTREIATLSTSIDELDTIMRQQTVASERMQQLHGRGVLPANRALEEGRALLMLRQQRVEITGRLTSLREKRDVLARERAQFASRRQTELLRELADALTRVNKLRAEVKAVEAKLLLFGRSHLPGTGGETDDLKITIHRNTKSPMRHLVVDRDMPILPGDVLDVTLGASAATGSASAPSDDVAPPAAPEAHVLTNARGSVGSHQAQP